MLKTWKPKNKWASKKFTGSYKKKCVPEIKKFICTLCQTPTYYDTLEKLQHHRTRFHDPFFNQTERGTKGKKYKDEYEEKKI